MHQFLTRTLQISLLFLIVGCGSLRKQKSEDMLNLPPMVAGPSEQDAIDSEGLDEETVKLLEERGGVR